MTQKPWGEFIEIQGQREEINKLLTNGLQLPPPTLYWKKGTLQLPWYKLWVKDVLPICETSSWWVLQISGETMPFLYMIWLKVNKSVKFYLICAQITTIPSLHTNIKPGLACKIVERSSGNMVPLEKTWGNTCKITT